MNEKNVPQKEAAYLKLYRRLREQIVRGDFRYGERLPSKRSLAEDFSVSVITVEHAYEILCEEGYVAARQRSGYFVSYRESDGFSALADGFEGPLPPCRAPTDMAAISPETFPFSTLSCCARRVLSVYGEKILEKTPSAGAPALRQAIADYLARSHALRVDAEQIIIGAGAEYLYGLFVQLLGRDKIYASEDPSYEKIRQVYLQQGVCCRKLKLGRDGILSAELQQTDAQVLHITPYRSFPSGITAGASKRREYLSWVTRGQRFLIEDDFESEFTVLSKMEDTVFSLDQTGRVIYLNTFTKTISPAIRVAYAVLPPVLAQRFHRKLGFYSCPVATFEQYLVTELLQSGVFERHVHRVRRRKRRLLAEQKGNDAGKVGRSEETVK